MQPLLHQFSWLICSTVVQIAKLSAKLEKGEGSAKAKPTTNTESSKLVTLSKAIDSIQENTKSLELMGNNKVCTNIL